MISDEERREAAKAIREIFDSVERVPRTFLSLSNFFLERVTIAVGLTEDNEFCELTDRLADLIDPQERTCSNISDAESYRWFECSECGCGLEVLNDEGISNIENRDGRFIDRPRYCPNCGARIVGVNNGDD